MQLQTIFKYSLDNVIILLGIIYTVESIINTWKKLKQQYKTHVDKRRRSGTERSKKGKFFDDLDEICGHRDIISPSSLFDSSTMDEVDSESVRTDELGKHNNHCSSLLQVLFISLFSTYTSFP